MKLSCNGCRVLRKGCTDDCTIRPCLQWIETPAAQANATVFLAKFYGRAGLLNLIHAGPEHLRPAIFRSLLYEACGRIVNPVYGSVGLLWSGGWQLCRAAVEAVLKGDSIGPPSADPSAAPLPPVPNLHDLRHISQDSGVAGDLHKVTGARAHFKRSAATKAKSSDLQMLQSQRSATGVSSLESMFAIPEASHVSQGMPVMEKELTLGMEPLSQAVNEWEDTTEEDIDLGLKLRV